MATANDDLTSLRKDVEQLRGDVASLLDSLKGIGIERGREAVSRAKRTGETVRAEAEELQRRAEREIGERPITSVLSAFGLGFLIGMLLDRRH